MASDMNDFIQTYSGRKFHFLDPKPDEIEIGDIAYALARLPRWNAATETVISVAQHSLYVFKILAHVGYPDMILMQGLMHDAAEAYLGDVASPIKARMPEFQAMELIVEAAIFDKYGIARPIDPIVKAADRELYRWEYRDLMKPRGMCMDPLGGRPTIHVKEPVDYVEHVFLDTFYELRAALREKEEAA